jgi:hypothetical protein
VSSSDGLAEAWQRARPQFAFTDTAWVVVLAASFRTPVRDAAAALGRLHLTAPVIGARLGADGWVPGAPPEPVIVDGDPLHSAGLLDRYDLERDPPLRVVIDATGHRVVLAGHHAAFDGRALTLVLAAIAGRPAPDAEPVPVEPPRRSQRRASSRLLGLLRPTDPIAASAGPASETLLSRAVVLNGPGITAGLAAAVVAAAGEHNARAGAPWRRVGISLGVGGPAGIGNLATYRRVDVSPDEPVAPAVSASLAAPPEPTIALPPGLARALAPLVTRLSDSVLVSNLGLVDAPGIERAEIYPVARGRSAVAVGAAGVRRGPSTITLRSQRLSPEDAAALLDGIAARLRPS